MPRNDLAAWLLALAITVALAAGLVYFVREVWSLLPPWLSLIVFILLAVAVIGYPIYALARLSDRYLARLKQTQRKPPERKDRKP